MSTTTRHIGNCQICERDQKVRAGVMVHHGYNRPGHGYIVGDCPAVGAVPYEVSCELIKTFKTQLENRLASQQRYLRKLESGEITHFTRYLQERVSFGKSELVATDYAIGVSSPYWWDQEMMHTISEVEYAIRQLTSGIARFAARIAAWKVLPIRTVEEERAKQVADREARRLVVQAQRDERAAKRAAIKAKQDALKAKRQAVIDSFVQRFQALAASPESLEIRKAEALKLALEMKLRKNHFVPHPFHIEGMDDALLTLGLAEPHPRPFGKHRLQYRYPF